MATMEVVAFLLTISFAVNVFGEMPPPAKLLIQDCKDVYLKPCPDYDGTLACLDRAKSTLVNYPDEVKVVDVAVQKLKNDPREADVCPSLTVEDTCYQEFYTEATKNFEETRLSAGFPQACQYISEAVNRLTELHLICQADMKKMNATAMLLELKSIQGNQCIDPTTASAQT